ncbi:hypothetical protein GCM10007897_20080 [Sphingobium jiangsuense]|uniref:General stress protein 26 n=1 Tax=Sphingobium jiangsuense TaxID=870476 RepID=A0A7W6BE93_9SPHN|nr:pyridoxamine 5'-phosphate oxidase family protein [Sphingobium jiangsuense]MBB3925233.1 general stress protein 26 [Sphingobium jiangsuense]GLT00620.1 hypothetical protein GCM10007897_20080 [Sphingobium jiangsuense]
MTDDIRAAMWKAMAQSPFLMVKLDTGHDHAEPLVAQLDEDVHGKFWFYTTRDNRIAPGGPAMAQFAARDHRLFCCISGTLVEEADPAVIERYWSPTIDSWYDGGRSDPDLLMMRFDLKEAEIWQPDSTLKGLFRLMSGKGGDPRKMGQHDVVSLE